MFSLLASCLILASWQLQNISFAEHLHWLFCPFSNDFKLLRYVLSELTMLSTIWQQIVHYMPLHMGLKHQSFYFVVVKSYEFKKQGKVFWRIQSDTRTLQNNIA